MKYQIYNGLFLTLPFDELEDTGAYLAMLSSNLKEKLESGKTPKQIIEDFFKEVRHSKHQRSSKIGSKDIKTLFNILQFVERQVVLFDAIEDAAFDSVHDMDGAGTIEQLINQCIDRGKEKKLEKILEQYKVRVVLTAHPTQFYPNSILGVISDLSLALKEDNLQEIQRLLLQMGKTRFKNREKPTPVEEADSLIWYLERVFYKVLPFIHNRIHECYGKEFEIKEPLIDLGFWPGGDRDGNPFVTSDTTLKVASMLKSSIINLYLEDIKFLKKRLTFEGVDEKLESIEQSLSDKSKAEFCNLEESVQIQCKSSSDLLESLAELRTLLIEQHQGLFLDHVDSFINKVKIFGFYFASLDLRQDSRIHSSVISEVLDVQDYADKKQIQKNKILNDILHKKVSLKNKSYSTENLSHIAKETLDSYIVARNIQESNGICGLNRYIISNTQSAENILEVMALAKLSGWDLKDLNLKIVPLFETVEDLENAEEIMESLYKNEIYKKHLKKFHFVQTIMLGFSDGTKDGGYFTANWSIFKAKRKLTEISRKYGVKVVFFDGRGGPPARGGGNTHKFYRSMGEQIENDEIQLTIQGQTISSTLGTKHSAKFNLEQLFTAGIEPKLFPEDNVSLTNQDLKLFEELSQKSYAEYMKLRNHKLFTAYLEEVTPLSFYEKLNIGSRPAKRKKSQGLKFEDLRAIPFVGAWTQMKQNIAGFYGFGTALQSLIQQGKKAKLKKLYEDSLFFRTLVENAMQSLTKSFFPLTFYLKDDKKYGAFWKLLYNESLLTEKLLKEISGQDQLLEESDISRESIKMREKIVLPLLVIQHYAMSEARALKKKPSQYPKDYAETLEKMIVKSLAANVNASRNSV